MKFGVLLELFDLIESLVSAHEQGLSQPLSDLLLCLRRVRLSVPLFELIKHLFLSLVESLQFELDLFAHPRGALHELHL